LERARIPKPGAYRASTKSIGDPADIEKLADILVNSERPCALFGTQVWTSRGHDAAVELCRALNMPGYMNGSSRGIFAPGDPHGFNRTRSLAFDKADVIVIVGCPFDFRLGYGRRLRADATVVQIDLDYRNVGKNRDISLGLVGDCGAILKAVEQAATGRVSKGNAQRAEWMKELRAGEAKAYEKLLPSFKSESTPINPYRVAYEINEFLTDNTVYIGDGGDVVTITATAVEPRKAGHWMDPGPLGTLGVGTSFSMATKFVHPQKEVLCYYGDGSFGMTAWDMETAQRFKLPYMAVIGNNSAMNQIRCGQIGKYGPERGSVGNKLGDVDFEKFAECFGGWGIAVREPSQIRPALEKARERVAGGQCAIVNIWVDINEYAPGTKAQTMYK
jgi:acetolactate synthase-1/2/3 large subunit